MDTVSISCSPFSYMWVKTVSIRRLNFLTSHEGDIMKTLPSNGLAGFAFQHKQDPVTRLRLTLHQWKPNLACRSLRLTLIASLQLIYIKTVSARAIELCIQSEIYETL